MACACRFLVKFSEQYATAAFNHHIQLPQAQPKPYCCVARKLHPLFQVGRFARNPKLREKPSLLILLLLGRGLSLALRTGLRSWLAISIPTLRPVLTRALGAFPFSIQQLVTMLQGQNFHAPGLAHRQIARAQENDSITTRTLDIYSRNGARANSLASCTIFCNLKGRGRT